MKYFLLIISFLFINFYSVNGQVKLDYNSIPEELKTDANAVIRYESNQFEIKSAKNAIYTTKKVITILNKNGDKFANIYALYDKFRTVSNLKGSIYDSNGKLIKKIKTKDFKDQAISSGGAFFDDSRVKYYKVYQSNYPFTIEYEYTVSFNGFANIPRWEPISSLNISIENSDYSVIVSDKDDIHIKEFNLDNSAEIIEQDNSFIYKWQIENYPAIKSEPFSQFIYEYTPSVYIAPNYFYFDGYEGNQESWEGIGSWANILNQNRNDLTLDTKNKILNLTKNLTDPVAKAKVIYEFMQSKTRYVSIQLGIGGYQPFSALEIDKLGYGDCKALSNYTVALLKEVGIESHYTIIRAGRNTRNVYPDFSGIGQMNHVIVCVPFENDTIWLECTDQEQPFGFLGSFTDDRYALLVKPKGSKLVKTKSYSQKDNSQTRTIEVILNEDCSINAKVNTNYKAIQYDNISYQFSESQEEKRENLFKDLDLTNFDIIEFKYSQSKGIIPTATEYINLKINNYSSKSGKRMFLPLNILNKQTYIPKKVSNRNSDVLLKYAYSDYDTIRFKIPEKYIVEYIPDTTHIISSFGEYKSFVIQKENTIEYIRINKRNEGHFPKEKYPELISFFKEIRKADRQKAILIEKN